jgi:hypothetical protein
MGRYCAACDDYCDDWEYSNNQWNKGDGYSRCMECIQGGRVCADCGDWYDEDNYSNNQWSKGRGNSRCVDCVNPPPTYDCQTCGRSFTSQNNLDMHMQVHRPRSIPCPVCGEAFFASGANAVQHVESGYCTGCYGSQERARQHIYNYANSKKGMRPYLTETPLLTYDNNNNGGGGVPNFPYHCPDCHKAFRQLSQLLQHRDHKHGNHRLLTQY